MSKRDPTSKRSSKKESASKSSKPSDDSEDEAIEVERFLENVALLDGQAKLALTHDRVVKKNRFTFEAFVANWADYSKHRRCAPIPDDRRVILPPLRPGASDYIQAQTVTFGKRPYIIAQAPLRTTCNDFWRMVYHEEPLAILVILPKDEICDTDLAKSAVFWPMNLGESKNYYGSNMMITLDSHNPDKTRYDLTLTVSDSLYRQRFEDVSEKSSDKRYRLFHYNSWSEEGQTDPADLATFIKRKIVNTLEKPKPGEVLDPLLIVSLSGLNRAMAVCGLIEVAWNFELKVQKFDLISLTNELARQRPGALTDVNAFMSFYATAFKLAALYNQATSDEMDAVIKNLMKPMPKESTKKLVQSVGSLVETVDDDSLDLPDDDQPQEMAEREKK